MGEGSNQEFSFTYIQTHTCVHVFSLLHITVMILASVGYTSLEFTREVGALDINQLVIDEDRLRSFIG